MEIDGRLKKKKKRNGNGTQERRVIRDAHGNENKGVSCVSFFFFFFFRAALIYVEKNSGDERKE